ncbi:hypothetical protein NitYY0918_C0243 [Nitratiruptor sp. YY09-18]|nr:hypothetical protein NitYY0918_C0243 [Nitratiruptor sp. YY09-18]
MILFCPLFAKDQVFYLVSSVQVPNAYYFTPLAIHNGKAAFGYISKIKPTRDEVEKQRERIRQIIQANIEKEYGSMQRWEEENKKIAKESAKQLQKNAPTWLQHLFPPSLVKEAVPFLLKGALFFAMHTKTASEPYGNLGECGVIIFDGKLKKIKIGIDEPVIALDFSPDGKYLGVMSDLSYEDSKGRYHAVARITLIDAHSYKIIHQWIFANAVDQLAFDAFGRVLFIVHNPAKWNEKALRFIDIVTKRLLPQYIPFYCGSGSMWYGSVKKIKPCFCLSPKRDLLLLRNGDQVVFYNLKDLKKYGELNNEAYSSLYVKFAHVHPWLAKNNGEIIDYQQVKVMQKFHDPLKAGFVDAAFMPDDKRVIFTNHFGKFYIFVLQSGKLVGQTKNIIRDGGKLFVLTHDGRWIVTEHITNKFATYAGYLRRKKTDLKIIDPQTLRTVQRIAFPSDQTLITYALFGDRLIASDFDTLYIFERVK